MRKALLILIVALSVGKTSFSQIGNEIRNFVDSTEILVNNGRKFLLKTILEGDNQKAVEVYEYLKSSTEGKPLGAFTYSEVLLVTVVTHNFKEFAEYARNFKEMASMRRSGNAFEIFESVHATAKDRGKSILHASQTEDISEEEQRIVELFVLLLENNNKGEEYAQRHAEFAKIFQGTPYQEFYRSFLPKPYKKIAMFYAFGGSGVFPTGGLSEFFKGNGAVTISWDIAVNKFYMGLFMGGGNLKVNTPFSATTSTDNFVFEENDDFSYFEGGLKMGGYVVRNEHVHLAAYGSFIASSLGSNKTEPRDAKREIYIFNSASAGLGVHAEVKLFDYDPKNPYYQYIYGKGYVSMRLDGGFHRPLKFEHKEFEGNLAYLRLALVWGFGEF